MASVEADRLRRRLLRAGLVHPVVTAASNDASSAFVVPVHNDAAGLERLLRALRRDGPGARIMVVDDASADGPAIAAVCNRYGADVIRHESNQGPAAARNTGWRRIIDSSADIAAHPEVVVFLDADVVPTAGAIATMMAHFGDGEVAAVAPRIRASAGRGWAARYEADNSPLDMGAAPALVFPGTRVSYLPSAAIAVRFDVLQVAGGFDEGLRSGEDVDLIWRLVDDGHLVRYEPAAIVEHRNRPSVQAFARQRYLYGTSAASLAERHGAKVSPLQLPAPVAATTLAALFGGRVVRFGAAIAGAAGAVLLARKLSDKIDDAGPEAARLAAMTHGYALRGFAAAATRSWAPLLLLFSRTRRMVVAALVLPAVLDWIRTRPAIDPVTHLGLRAIDHGAYCAGVWAGVVRSRSLAALLPSVRFAKRQDD